MLRVLSSVACNLCAVRKKSIAAFDGMCSEKNGTKSWRRVGKDGGVTIEASFLNSFSLTIDD